MSLTDDETAEIRAALFAALPSLITREVVDRAITRTARELGLSRETMMDRIAAGFAREPAPVTPPRAGPTFAALRIGGA